MKPKTKQTKDKAPRNSTPPTEIPFPWMVFIYRCVRELVLTFSVLLGKLRQWSPYSMLQQRERRLYVTDTDGNVLVRPKWTERLWDVFRSDNKRQRALLRWLNTKLTRHTVEDFCLSWHDGTLLCSLLEAVVPGSCPETEHLEPHNMVNNCRLGMRIAHQYLGVPQHMITPEEMTIAHDKATERRIFLFVSAIKWLSESKQVQVPENRRHEFSVTCSVRGSGVKTGVTHRKCRFTIFISDITRLVSLCIKIRGPRGEGYAEVLENVFLHRQLQSDQSQAVKDSNREMSPDNLLDDGQGNTFYKQKDVSFISRFPELDRLLVTSKFCGAGAILVTYVPIYAGIHTIYLKANGSNIPGAPFRAKIFQPCDLHGRSTGSDDKYLPHQSSSQLSVEKPGDSVTSQISPSDVGLDRGNTWSMNNRTRTSLSTIGRLSALKNQYATKKRRTFRKIMTKPSEVDLSSHHTLSNNHQTVYSQSDVTAADRNFFSKSLGSGLARNPNSEYIKNLNSLEENDCKDPYFGLKSSPGVDPYRFSTVISSEEKTVKSENVAKNIDQEEMRSKIKEALIINETDKKQAQYIVSDTDAEDDNKTLELAKRMYSLQRSFSEGDLHVISLPQTTFETIKETSTPDLLSEKASDICFSIASSSEYTESLLESPRVLDNFSYGMPNLEKSPQFTRREQSMPASLLTSYGYATVSTTSHQSIDSSDTGSYIITTSGVHAEDNNTDNLNDFVDYEEDNENQFNYFNKVATIINTQERIPSPPYKKQNKFDNSKSILLNTNAWSNLEIDEADIQASLVFNPPKITFDHVDEENQSGIDETSDLPYISFDGIQTFETEEENSTHTHNTSNCWTNKNHCNDLANFVQDSSKKKVLDYLSSNNLSIAPSACAHKEKHNLGLLSQRSSLDNELEEISQLQQSLLYKEVEKRCKSDLAHPTSSPVPLIHFRAIHSFDSAYNTMNTADEFLVIAPTPCVHKTTQVSSQEILIATGLLNIKTLGLRKCKRKKLIYVPEIEMSKDVDTGDAFNTEKSIFKISSTQNFTQNNFLSSTLQPRHNYMNTNSKDEGTFDLRKINQDEDYKIYDINLLHDKCNDNLLTEQGPIRQSTEETTDSGIVEERNELSSLRCLEDVTYIQQFIATEKQFSASKTKYELPLKTENKRSGRGKFQFDYRFNYLKTVRDLKSTLKNYSLSFINKHSKKSKNKARKQFRQNAMLCLQICKEKCSGKMLQNLQHLNSFYQLPNMWDDHNNFSILSEKATGQNFQEFGQNIRQIKNYDQEKMITIIDELFEEAKSEVICDWANQERVVGPGIYYGNVGVKNNFQIFTNDLPSGCPTLTMIGPKSDSVIELTIVYTGDCLYEVFYEVKHVGTYIISIKLLGKCVGDSPYICKINI